MKAVSGRELARILERKGWRCVRVRGSHHVYTKGTSHMRISVPIHGKQPLKRGLQRALMKAAEIREEEL